MSAGLSILFFFFVLEVDPSGAQEKVLEIAGSLGLKVSVGIAHEVSVRSTGISSYLKVFLDKQWIYRTFLFEHHKILKLTRKTYDCSCRSRIHL